jgi:hypothetical protein
MKPTLGRYVGYRECFEGKTSSADGEQALQAERVPHAKICAVGAALGCVGFVGVRGVQHSKAATAKLATKQRREPHIHVGSFMFRPSIGCPFI